MVVTDSFLFPPTAMIKVRVTNMTGAEMIVEVNLAWKCDKLKLSLEPLLDMSSRGGDAAAAIDTAKNSVQFKLILLRTGTTLNDEATLQQQGLKNNDELLLLKRRLIAPIMEIDKQREDRKVPDAASIRKATENIPKKNHDCPLEEASSNLDFQSELRRILISLIEASQRILFLNPEAAKIFKQAEDILNEAPARRTRVEETSVKQLTDMGFPENRARKALLLNQQSVQSAIVWLLSNESDPDIDKPLPCMDASDDDDDDDNDSDGDNMNCTDAATGDNGDSIGAVKAKDKDASRSRGHENQEEGAVGGAAAGESPRFKNILDIIRAFQRREFRPDPRALQNLIEMGFSEKDAVTALRNTCNKENAACEWLLSDRQEKPQESDEGLDVNSPVYKAIMSHPAVQLGLNSPKCLLAFLQMLENPIKAGAWLNDPETGPLLIQISRIYHAEKLTAGAPSPKDVR